MNTLTHFFDWLIAANVRASFLTLAVLIVQAVLRQSIPARWRYALWLPVLLVLLMPALPESRWSLGSIFSKSSTTAAVMPPAASMPPATPASPLPDTEASSEALPVNWQRVLLIVWLTGASSMLLAGAVSFAFTLRRFKQSRLPPGKDMLSILSLVAGEIKLRRLPRVLSASTIHSPAVTGFLRPTLLLPVNFDEAFTPEEVRLVLKHELTHIKRGDLPLNALLCLLLALHWFNPLLWLAFFKARLDRETACDAEVLRDETPERRIGYGHALLKVEASFCPRGLSLGFVGIFQRGAALRLRIQSIVTEPKIHPLMKTCITLSIVLLTFFGITKAQQSDLAKADEKTSPVEFLQAKLDKIILPRVQFRDATIGEAVEFLRVKSREFDATTQDPKLKGVNMIIRADGIDALTKLTLDLKDAPLGEALRYVAELAKLKYEVQPYAIVLRVNDSRIRDAGAHRDQEKGLESFKARGGAIILPRVELREAKLSEALDFIRVKALELDPDRKGVNIVVRPGGDENVRITLSLKDVPVSEALNYCAELGGHKLSGDDHAFLLIPEAVR